MSIKLSIEGHIYQLAGRPETLPLGNLSVTVGQGSHGINTRGVQDIIISDGNSAIKMHLSRRNGKSAISRLPTGEIITAIRENP